MSISEEYTFDAHRENCWAVAVHEMLPLMATVSSDKTCKIFDLSTRKLQATLGDGTHSKTTRCVAFKPSVEFPTVAVGSFDATVSIWGRDSEVDEAENELMQEEGETDFNEEQETIGDGGWELLAIIEGHENEVKSVDWSFDGRYLATSSRDKSAWIWETDETNEEFECINVIQEHEQDVKQVRWSPYEHALATSSYDESTKVFRQDDYDEDDWVNVASLADAKGTIWSADFDKQEGVVRLVNSSDDSYVRVYKKIGKDASNATAAASAGVAVVPTSLREEEQWRLQGTLPHAHDRPVYSVDWGKNGLIATTGSDGRLVVYKETSEGVWTVIAKHELAHGVSEVNCVKWWGDKLLTAGDDGKVRLWTVDLTK